jgi:HD superfamily phosphohydrolase
MHAGVHHPKSDEHPPFSHAGERPMKNTKDSAPALRCEALVRPESQMDSCNVICPYCLHEYQAECEDFNENEREEECENCGKTYLLYQEFDVTHHTRPVPNARISPTEK